jgi:hypothetical protein
MTQPQVPRIVVLLVAVGLVLAADRVVPGVVAGVLLLLVLYAVLTNVDRFTALTGQSPAWLRGTYAPGAGGRPPLAL